MKKQIFTLIVSAPVLFISSGFVMEQGNSEIETRKTIPIVNESWL